MWHIRTSSSHEARQGLLWIILDIRLLYGWYVGIGIGAVVVVAKTTRSAQVLLLQIPTNTNKVQIQSTKKNTTKLLNTKYYFNNM